MKKIEVNGQALNEAEADLLIRSLKSARSIPAGTVREYAELKKRKEDPNDGAHRTLTARWEGIEAGYVRDKAIVDEIDALLAKLEG